MQGIVHEDLECSHYMKNFDAGKSPVYLLCWYKSADTDANVPARACHYACPRICYIYMFMNVYMYVCMYVYIIYINTHTYIY